MTTVSRTAGPRFTRILLIATATLAAGVLGFPAAALADGHGHGYGHSNGHTHGDARGYAASPYVPSTIVVGQRGYYQPYYGGRVYYGPHHHYHSYYNFPVYVGGSMVYRPYYYCGDSLFMNGAVTLPHLAFGINFGSPGGVSLGGFYTSPSYVAPAPYPYVAYTVPPPYPVPAPYDGGEVWYRGRHCEHGEGYYEGN
jgi:hypothetical protein